MEHRADTVAVDRLLEPARSEIREDFRRLAFDRRANRGIVQQRHAAGGAQAREGRLELQRFVDRLLHESLDRPFAPRPERPAPEAAAKTLDSGEADAMDLGRFTIEDRHPGVRENLPDFILVAALVIMIAEDGDDGNVHRGGQLSGENACLFRQPVVGEVATEDQDIRAGADLREHRVKDPLRRLRDVNIADRGDAKMLPRRGRPFHHDWLWRYSKPGPFSCRGGEAGLYGSQPPIPSLKSNQPNPGPRSWELGVGSWELNRYRCLGRASWFCWRCARRWARSASTFCTSAFCSGVSRLRISSRIRACSISISARFRSRMVATASCCACVRLSDASGSPPPPGPPARPARPGPPDRGPWANAAPPISIPTTNTPAVNERIMGASLPIRVNYR